ncbi:AAA family ATPase [Rhodococcus erythropolis]|uniref:AAA family ATPase n=1 Tax=Rhodococcus erythropolis TaxID=1833 RepID=UPI001BA9632A|nr:AAA family ATPase [Rhodococcus erythropolis]MBS2990085.1 AAA family ATPase [Rhodococcus erythropolis]
MSTFDWASWDGTAELPLHLDFDGLPLQVKDEVRELMIDAPDPADMPKWLRTMTGVPWTWAELQEQVTAEWAAADAVEAAETAEWKRGRDNHERLDAKAAQYGVDHKALREATTKSLVHIAGRELAEDIVARHNAEGVEVPEGTTAEALWDAEIPEVVHRIAGLWGVGANVVFRAQNKTGKSTATHNVIRSLVSGEPLFGAYAVAPVGRVVLLDSELPQATIMQWWRKLGLRSGVTVHALSGVEHTFNILDERVRTAWAAKLRGHDILVLDCLGPFMKALGLDENREGGHYLAALRMLAHEAGIGEILVVHHMGHSGERSRGDSSIDGWGDDLWSLSANGDTDRDPNAVRYFAARGRNSAVAREPLQFDPATRLLTVDHATIDRNRHEVEVAAMLWDRVHEGVTATVRDGTRITTENRLTISNLTSTVYAHVRKDGVPRKLVENTLSRMIGPGGVLCVEAQGATKRMDFKDPLAASAASPGNPFRTDDGTPAMALPGVGNPLLPESVEA